MSRKPRPKLKYPLIRVDSRPKCSKCGRKKVWENGGPYESKWRCERCDR